MEGERKAEQPAPPPKRRSARSSSAARGTWAAGFSWRDRSGISANANANYRGPACQGLIDQTACDVPGRTLANAKIGWSADNFGACLFANDIFARPSAEGRMTEHGLKQVSAAKADGRWDRAYRVKGSEIPADLQAAIDAEPAAKAMLAKLTAQNRFALIFWLGAINTEAGRQKKIAALVAMLARGETLHLQKSG